jgi:hypothetical protein
MRENDIDTEKETEGEREREMSYFIESFLEQTIGLNM